MDQISFARELIALWTIVFRINRSISRSSETEELRGISDIQLQAMIMMQHHGMLNMTELADRMLMARQQLTKMIDSLVEKGLVERGVDPNNRKHVMIKVSEEGENFLKELIMTRPNIMSKLIEALDEEDAKKILDAVVAIREVLSKFDKTHT